MFGLGPLAAIALVMSVTAAVILGGAWVILRFLSPERVSTLLAILTIIAFVGGLVQIIVAALR